MSAIDDGVVRHTKEKDGVDRHVAEERDVIEAGETSAASGTVSDASAQELAEFIAHTHVDEQHPLGQFRPSWGIAFTEEGEHVAIFQHEDADALILGGLTEWLPKIGWRVVGSGRVPVARCAASRTWAWCLLVTPDDPTLSGAWPTMNSHEWESWVGAITRWLDEHNAAAGRHRTVYGLAGVPFELNRLSKQLVAVSSDNVGVSKDCGIAIEHIRHACRNLLEVIDAIAGSSP